MIGRKVSENRWKHSSGSRGVMVDTVRPRGEYQIFRWVDGPHLCVTRSGRVYAIQRGPERGGVIREYLQRVDQDPGELRWSLFLIRRNYGPRAVALLGRSWLGGVLARLSGSSDWRVNSGSARSV